ncbi:MAG: hypothetical protein WD851_08905 [Pirellulales bacterium]
MSDREKKLGLGVLVVLLLWGGWMGWNKYQDTLRSKRVVLAAAEEGLRDVEFELTKAKYAAGQVTKWEEQSLPRDKSVAQSVYRSWLIDQLEESKLQFRDVQPGTGSRSNEVFEGLAFNIDAEGDLPAIIRFLHAFHRNSAMHKITLLHLRPALQGGNLNVTCNVEALVMPSAARTSGMPEGASKRPAVAEVDHYLKNIVSRNPFVPYKPLPPKVELTAAVEEATPPPFDESTQAFLTGIVGIGEEFQAWVNVRTTNKNLRLIAGDELKVGALAARVVEVRSNRLVIEIDDKRQTIKVGKTLRDGVAEDGEI